MEVGLEGFSEHEVLELILFYALPYQDTNPLAHELIRRFGSLAGVFEAPMYQLLETEGVGEHTAVLLKLMPQVSREYLVSRAKENEIILTPDDANNYVRPLFIGEREEVVYLICLDTKCMVVNCSEVGRGELDSARVSVRKIVEHALRHDASSVILTHNHVSGIPLPSEEDISATRMVQKALSSVGIVLADHIVVANKDSVSMARFGYLLRE